MDISAPDVVAMGRTADATRVELGLWGSFDFGQESAFGSFSASQAVGGSGGDSLDLKASIGVNFSW